MVKVLGVIGSPRLGGNTEIMVREALAAAAEQGAEIEFIHLAEKSISPCEGCFTCEETSKCKIEDDMQEIYTKLEEADAIILGTPVYFANVTAQAKAFMDRTYCLYRKRRLRGKVAAAIAVARRVGGIQVLSSLYLFFAAHGMHIAGGTVGHGREKGEVREGVGIYKGALEEARAVGRAVVRLVGELKR